jgi:hypothetical protein
VRALGEAGSIRFRSVPGPPRSNPRRGWRRDSAWPSCGSSGTTSAASAGAATRCASSNTPAARRSRPAIVWAGETPLADAVEQNRKDAFVIPFGGSSPASIEGYATCGRELKAQLGDFDAVVTAVGSGGTMAGLVKELGPERVIGVDTGAVPDPRATVAGLLGHPDF